jgi:hypothetical protein
LVVIWRVCILCADSISALGNLFYCTGWKLPDDTIITTDVLHRYLPVKYGTLVDDIYGVLQKEWMKNVGILRDGIFNNLLKDKLPPVALIALGTAFAPGVLPYIYS